MYPAQLKTAQILSALIAILAAVASLGGLFIPGLYRDNAWTTSQWYGNDAVTLLVAVPILVVALILFRRNSQRAFLVWVGMLHYMLYNFAFYLFSAAFNPFFLIYSALFALAILTLLITLLNVDIPGLSKGFRAQTPVKWVAGYMLFVGLVLGGLWVGLSLGFVFTGQVPQVVIDSAHPTSVVFAIDLTLLVPFFLLGATLLWMRRPWGYALGVIVNSSGAVYTLALAGMGFTADRSVVTGADALIPMWLTLSALSLLAAGIMLKNLKAAGEWNPLGRQAGLRHEFSGTKN